MMTLTQVAGVAAASMFSVIWQSALLVLCVAILLRLLPGVTAAGRSLVWAAVFFLTLVLPFAGLASRGSEVHSAAARFQFNSNWAVGVMGLWIGFSVLRAVRLLQSGFRLHRIVSHAVAIVPPRDIAALLSAAKPTVRLCTSSEVDTPSVAGFFHRRILLPVGLMQQVAPADLHQIVLHEIEHLRRWDDWTNLVQKLGLVVFPLQPTLLWVERRLCVERELACDDGVLRATGGAAKAYATCLTNLAERSVLRRGVSLALGAWQHKSELAGRVYRILGNPVRQMKPFQSAALAGLILSAAAGTAMLAARSPQLITFATASPASSFALASPAIQAQTRPAGVTLVKATLTPRFAATTLSVPRQRVPRRHRVASGVRRSAETRDVILIGWTPDQFRRRRLTAVPAKFQLTYAAVPTRTGWLFFQL